MNMTSDDNSLKTKEGIPVKAYKVREAMIILSIRDDNMNDTHCELLQSRLQEKG